MPSPVASSAAAAASASAAATARSAPTASSADSEMDKTVARKKRRLLPFMSELEAAYFSTRNDGKEGEAGEALRSLGSVLCDLTQHSSLRIVSTVRYGDMYNSSCILSSIEFDYSQRLFATAGVTKRIKIFQYSAVIDDAVPVSMPVADIASRNKLTCLSWNSYCQSHLACSDYTGAVTVWDAETGDALQIFAEHDKRVWSVDFCRPDPTRLVSGSDDFKVKLWSTNRQRSVMTIDTHANICCVKFNPELPHSLIVGSADSQVHSYDLRFDKKPVSVYKGHRQAVSYVQFLSADQFASASIDSTLRLWDCRTAACLRTYSGHSNEKNFTGLDTRRSLLACGSEKNNVVVYHKSLSSPVLKHSFDLHDPYTGEWSRDDSPQYVSNVCWKRDSNILLAANSQGIIRVLELVEK
eukprot:PLAT13017.1.p1 GENE.PLAT13017.1~~PLAT13017.1.p1  ORF type:complete len:467 (-),score=209.74 PLAT13017.1:126-1358(-)